MKKPKQIEDRHVFVECALQLAVAVHRHCAIPDSKSRRWVGEARTRDSQRACDLLVTLGLLTWRDGQGYLWTVEKQKLRRHLEVADAPSVHLLERVIVTFVDFASFHGYVSEGRAPFAVDKGAQPAMWALVRAGYATRVPLGFKWTDKIAPMLVEAGLWAHDGVPVAQDHTAGETLAERIWQTIPAWRRHWLAHRLGGASGSAFFYYVSKRWTGRRLSYFKTPPPRSARDWRILPADLPGAAEEVQERLLKMRRPRSG